MPARQTSTTSLLSCVLSCRCIRTGKQQTLPGVLLLCVICGLTVYMLWALPNCPLLGRSPQQCSILSMPPHLQVANPAPGPAAVCGTQALCKLWSLPHRRGRRPQYQVQAVALLLLLLLLPGRLSVRLLPLLLLLRPAAELGIGLPSHPAQPSTAYDTQHSTHSTGQLITQSSTSSVTV